MSQQLEQKVERLENRLEELEQKLEEEKQQPGEHLKVWGPDGGPGHPKIAEVIKEVKEGPKNSGADAGKVEAIVDRGRTRTLEIMREIARGHDQIVFRKGRSRNPSSLYWKD